MHSLSAAFLFVPRKNAMWKFDLTYKLVCCIIFGELQDCDDVEPFPYDLEEKGLWAEVRYSLGIEKNEGGKIMEIVIYAKDRA